MRVCVRSVQSSKRCKSARQRCKVLAYRGYALGHVVGDESNIECRANLAVYPDSCRSSIERGHTLGEETDDESREDVARPRGCEMRACRRILHDGSVRVGDQRLGSLEEDDCA